MADVLVVDDDKFFCEVLVDVLRDKGKSASIAHSGIAALQCLAEDASPPAVIVLDLDMPGMNGLEFLRRKKSLEAIQSIPVIFCSNNWRISHLKASSDVIAAFDKLDYLKVVDTALDVMMRLGHQKKNETFENRFS